MKIDSPNRTEVNQALDAILASRPFRTSHQCSSLLRYIVEHTLNGDDSLLRERVIGSEVFGRRPDYEPGEDPVVRLRASEVRKRLAQYNQEREDPSQVHIGVPAGGYRAIFSIVREPVPAPSSATAPIPTPSPAPLTPPVVAPDLEALSPEPALAPVLPVPEPTAPNTPTTPWDTARRTKLLWLGLGLLFLCGIAAALVTGFRLVRHDSSRQAAFWAPLLTSADPLTLCIADYTAQDLSQPDWSTQIASVIAGTTTSSRVVSDRSLPLVPLVDSTAANKIAYWLGMHGASFQLQRSSKLTLDELRRRPAVLIGAFDNDWSLVLLSKLRYHVQIEPVTRTEWVQDSRDAGNQKWKSPGDMPYSASFVDYAIVTRLLEPQTGQWLVAVGGLGMHGTEAAVDLITEKQFDSTLPALAAQKNVQMVIRTTVINGHGSVPQIMAIEVW